MCLQRHAWQFFYQMRTCPPLEVLRQGSEEAEKHLSACPSCREILSGGEVDMAWAELAKHLKSNLPSPRIPQVRPGQVWGLNNDLEGWDSEGIYLRTLQVLILSKHSGIRAVPICPETKLAGERDVFLSREMGFAEAWNQRAIAFFSLGKYVESIRDCHQTLEVNPYHFAAAAGMGQAYLQLGNHVSALECFRRALRLNPSLEGVRVQIDRLSRMIEDK